MLVPLILVSILDLALALLLVVVSGLIFGGGPEGANGEPIAVVLWIFGLLACILAPAGGFILRSHGRAGWGMLTASVPPVVGVLFIGI